MYIEIKGVRIEVADDVDVSVDGCVVRVKAKAPSYSLVSSVWHVPASGIIGGLIDTPNPYSPTDGSVELLQLTYTGI